MNNVTELSTFLPHSSTRLYAKTKSHSTAAALSIKAQLANKIEELADLTEEQEKLKTDHEKQVAKLVKQQETLKAKLEKITEEKKEKMNQIKEVNKLHKELEIDQKNQIQRLTKENEELTKRDFQHVSKLKTN